MNGEIGAPIQQGFFDLLDEQALATDLVERAILHAVARGGDVQFFDLDRRVQAPKLGDQRPRLGERERALAGGYDDATAHLATRAPAAGAGIRSESGFSRSSALVSPGACSSSSSRSRSRSSANSSDRDCTRRSSR